MFGLHFEDIQSLGIFFLLHNRRKRQRQSMTKVVQKKDASHSERIKIPQKDRKLANGSTNEVTANCTSESEPKSKSK